MARTSTNTSKNVVIPAESAEAVKQNLRQVAQELARVRDRAREEADSLDRIRGMIDLKYLNDLLSAIDTLEGRVKRMEQGTEVSRWRKELEIEQGRLAKLWDAFKTQEDELKAVARERDEVLGELRSLEKELGSMGSPGQIRTRILTLDSTNRRLENDLNSAVERAERNARTFAEEQERLAKLYKVYEDTQAQLERLQKKANRKPRLGPAPKKPAAVKGSPIPKAAKAAAPKKKAAPKRSAK